MTTLILKKDGESTKVVVDSDDPAVFIPEAFKYCAQGYTVQWHGDIWRGRLSDEIKVL